MQDWEMETEQGNNTDKLIKTKWKHKDYIHSGTNETQVGQSAEVKHIRAVQEVTRGGKLDRIWVKFSKSSVQ